MQEGCPLRFITHVINNAFVSETEGQQSRTLVPIFTDTVVLTSALGDELFCIVSFLSGQLDSATKTPHIKSTAR